MVNPIDIYHFPMSPPSRAALLIISALGLQHNVNIVDINAGEQMKPDFLKMNPLHTVPVINDNGFVVYDSHAIMKYLVSQYAKDDHLCPKDPKREAIVNERLYFEATYLFPSLKDFAIPTMISGTPPTAESRKKLEESLEYMDNFLMNETWFAGPDMTIADFSIITTFSNADAIQEFDLKKYDNLWQWYQRAKSAMSSFGYDEIVQPGATAFGEAFKSKLK